ncbi:MAG: flagellar basal body L-ring protein FlgH [Armatimonadetes bacterium]|nr:flagellar basal body L-ring protein FlgH [Armatimonadota bacterium]
MKKIWILLALASSLGVAQTNSLDNDGSLVPDRIRNPFVDRTATKVGDLLTIIVDENFVSTLTANTTGTKKDSNIIDKLGLPFGKIPLLKEFLGGFSTGNTSQTTGTGTTNNTSRLQARITVIVKQVLPNGALVLEGQRAVKVNKDLQLYKFSGVVRKEDVRRDNTVLSEQVAEANITTDGKGLIGDRQRKGILTRLLDWLF